MRQPLNEIERVHYYLLTQWISAVRDSNEELRAYYNDALDAIYPFVPERKLTLHPAVLKVLDFLERLGINVWITS